MKVRTSVSLLLAFMISAAISSSCTNYSLTSKGEQLNKDLEGEWEIEEYLLNGNDASGLLPDTYLVFAPSLNDGLSGKLITTPEGGQSTVQEYTLSQDGKKISIDGAENDIELEGSLLTIEGSLVEDGLKIEVELVLDKQ